MKMKRYHLQVPLINNDIDQNDIINIITEISNDQSCVTVSGDAKGEPCQFPFRENGKMVYGCVPRDMGNVDPEDAEPALGPPINYTNRVHRINVYWCSTL